MPGRCRGSRPRGGRRLAQHPPLVGIVQAPTLPRPTARCSTRPGYDAASGLLLDPGDIAFPPIPTAPSRAEAERALGYLREPFAAFPFAAEADLAVILSAVLTALCGPPCPAQHRRSCSLAPVMGSGKTCSATIVSYIATGRAPAMMSQADDAEAERKRLLAACSWRAGPSRSSTMSSGLWPAMRCARS
ncbi:MAG: hypothetical protein U1E17_12690 [Geminicoccaceae bacterium]